MRAMSDEPTRRDIGAVLAEFARSAVDQPSLEQILARLGDYCTELLPVTGVGVLLRNANGGMEVATANTELGQIVETLEAELVEGPCTDSLRSGEQVVVPDLKAVEESYPRFAPAALEAGVRAIHALPMTMRTEVVGSVDIIATDVLDLSAADLAAAQLLADVTASYIANSRAFAESSRLAEQLQQALDSRIVIEQAKGRLSERHNISVSEAFDRLRRHARNNGLKLREVSDSVTRGELDP